MDKIAVIEARLYAGRLPGKVLMPLAGITMIERIIDKVKCSNLLDDIVLATTSNSEDDLVDWKNTHRIKVANIDMQARICALIIDILSVNIHYFLFKIK